MTTTATTTSIRAGVPGRSSSPPDSVADSRLFLGWDELVLRAAEGDQGALAVLYEQSSSLVYGLALRILGRPEDAEEVTLDVYSQVWKQASRFDRRRGNARSWLMVLTRSRAIDHLRSSIRYQCESPLETVVGSLASNAKNPEEQAVSNQRSRRVREALTSLPQTQRDAIELAFFSGLSHSEVAKTLSRPLGTVKTRIRTGMSRLREFLVADAGSETSTTLTANPGTPVS